MNQNKDVTMKLMAINEYLSTRFTKTSQPCRRTIIRRINEGSIPGTKIGRYYFVDIEAEANFSSQALTDKILFGFNQL